MLFPKNVHCLSALILILGSSVCHSLQASGSPPSLTSSLSTSGTFKNVSSSSRITGAGTLLYKDPNLTGCYAGNGGATTVTLSSGDSWPFLNGSISTVSQIQTTSLPCDEFLRLGPYVPWRIKSAFADSPVCASYAKLIENTHTTFPASVGEIPGLANGNAHIAYNCCGGCQFFAPEVQLYIWPPKSSSVCSASNGSATETHSEVTGKQTLGVASTVVIGESVFTSPSYYLAITGTLGVFNSCGRKGKVYTNPTIPIATSDLSTLSYSDNAIQFNGFPAQTGSYDPVACHTYGLNNGTTHLYSSPLIFDGMTKYSAVEYSQGPPYNPILLPPKELTALDPAWEACTSWMADGDNNYAVFFGLYDPPRTLDPATALVDPTATPVPDPNLSPNSPKPSPSATPSPPAPKVTADPAESGPPSSSKSQSADPNQQGKLDSKSDPNDPSQQSALGRFIMRPFASDPLQQPTPTDSSNLPGEPTPHSLVFEGTTFKPDPAGHFVVEGQTLSPGNQINVHGTVLSQAPNGEITNPEPRPQPTGNPPAAAPSPNPAPTSPLLLQLDTSTFTPDSSSHFSIVGQIISPGSQITVQGTPISLAADGRSAVIAGSTQQLHANAPAQAVPETPAPSPIPLTFVGSTFKPDSSSNFHIASQDLSPGSEIIVHGSTISLALDGHAAVVAGSTQALITTPAITHGSNPSASLPRETVKYMVYNGNTYTAGASSDLVIADQTIAPGSQVALSGGRTTISLSPDGSTAVAVADGSTSTLALLTQVQPYVPVVTVDGVPATAVPGSGLWVAGGQTLTSGGAITVGSETVTWGQIGSSDGVKTTIGNNAVTARFNGTGTEGTVNPGAVAFEGLAGLKLRRVRDLVWHVGVQILGTIIFLSIA